MKLLYFVSRVALSAAMWTGMAQAQVDRWQPYEFGGASGVSQNAPEKRGNLDVGCYDRVLTLALGSSVVKQSRVGTPVDYRLNQGPWKKGFTVVNKQDITRFAEARGEVARKILKDFLSAKTVDFRVGGTVVGGFSMYGLKENREYYDC